MARMIFYFFMISLGFLVSCAPKNVPVSTQGGEGGTSSAIEDILAKGQNLDIRKGTLMGCTKAWTDMRIQDGDEDIKDILSSQKTVEIRTDTRVCYEAGSTIELNKSSGSKKEKIATLKVIRIQVVPFDSIPEELKVPANTSLSNIRTKIQSKAKSPITSTTPVFITHFVVVEGGITNNPGSPTPTPTPTPEFVSEDVSTPDSMFSKCDPNKPAYSYLDFADEQIPYVQSSQLTGQVLKGTSCFKIGSTVDLRGKNKVVRGKGKVTRLQLVMFDSLTADQAHLENKDLDKLKADLIARWGEGIKTLPLTVIYFSFIAGSAQ